MSLNPELRHLTTVLCCPLYSFLKIIFVLQSSISFWTLFFPHVYKVQLYKLCLWTVIALLNNSPQASDGSCSNYGQLSGKSLPL